MRAAMINNLRIMVGCNTDGVQEVLKGIETLIVQERTHSRLPSTNKRAHAVVAVQAKHAIAGGRDR